MTQITRLPSLIASLSLGAVLAVGTGLVPTAAHAESVAVADQAGDPVKLSGDTPETQPASGSSAVDVLRTRFDYRAQSLVVRTTAAKAAKNVQQVVRVRSGGADQYYFTVSDGRVTSEEGICRGGSSRADKSSATYTVKIPARCFGAPRTVRAGILLTRYNERNEAYAFDDAQRAGTDVDRDIALGRALARG